MNNWRVVETKHGQKEQDHLYGIFENGYFLKENLVIEQVIEYCKRNSNTSALMFLAAINNEAARIIRRKRR